ncbi:MAG: ABC transporter permease subunit [Chloroflexi bacterium]|nr:ABC transporter permease subunit [Chloroflexota bacterium]
MTRATLDFLWSVLPSLLIGFPGGRPGGLALTLILSLAAIGLGFVIALGVGPGRAAGPWPVRAACALYVEFFRGLPLLLLLFVVHVILGGRRLGLDLSPRASALIALTLYASAYQAEILRAGLAVVPDQLVESARLVGGRAWQIYLHVRLSYAVQVMLPAFAGQAITLFKDSAVLVALGVGELMTVTRSALGSDVRNAAYWLPTYLLVGGLYALVAFAISRLAGRLERRQRSGDLLYSLTNY